MSLSLPVVLCQCLSCVVSSASIPIAIIPIIILITVFAVNLVFVLTWRLACSCCKQVMLERRQYAPVGWTKKYEFSDADQVCGRDIIDAWIDGVSNGAPSSESITCCLLVL